MRKLRTVVLLILAAVLLGSLGVYALGTFGSESDPLITMSYLEKVLRPELEQQFAAETEAALREGNSGRIAQMNSEYLDAPTLLAALLNHAAAEEWQTVIGAHSSAAEILGVSQMDDITTYFCLGFGPAE